MATNLSEKTADFSLPIPESIRTAANLESQPYRLSSLKAEQVYLSHLASYAVRYYLNLCGYPTPARRQGTLDFVGRALSDSATVEVVGYGHIACVVVPEEAIEIDIPSMTLQNPIGYVAVMLNNDLSEATLIGFLSQTDCITVARSKLRSLLELPGYLAQVNSVTAATVQLGRWWERSFEIGWTLISELTNDHGLETSFAFRSSPGSTNSSEHSLQSQSNLEGSAEDTKDGLVCQKTISLTNAEEETFSLSLKMERPDASQRTNIVAKLSPNLGQAYLPEGVQLSAMDDTGTLFSSMRSRSGSEFVEIRFSADSGDYFSLEIAFDGVSITENFVV